MLFQAQHAKTQGPSFHAVLLSWLWECPRRDLLLFHPHAHTHTHTDTHTHAHTQTRTHTDTHTHTHMV